jgi:excisionase family DNA binding protein
MLDSAEKSAGIVAAMLDVKAVAALLSVSPRTVYRLADSGRMPSPAKLNALVRWSRASVENWLAAGCPPCKSVRQTGGCRRCPLAAAARRNGRGNVATPLVNIERKQPSAGDGSAGMAPTG